MNDLKSVYDASLVREALRIPLFSPRRAVFPWSLSQHYIEIAVPGMSLIRLLEAWERGRGRVNCYRKWLDEQPVATQERAPCIRRIRKEGLRLTGRRLSPRQRLEYELFPELTTVLTTMMVHYRVTGIRLYEGFQIRCKERTKDGSRLDVGWFGNDIFIGCSSKGPQPNHRAAPCLVPILIL